MRHGLTVAGPGRDLRAELRDGLLLVRQLLDLSAVFQLVAERLLGVDVLAAREGVEHDRRMHVIRRGDVHGIDLVPFLLEHLLPVAVDARIGEALVRGGQIGGIDVAERGDVRPLMRGDVVEVGPRHVRRADTRMGEPRIRTPIRQNRGEGRHGRESRGRQQELTTIHFNSFGCFSFNVTEMGAWSEVSRSSVTCVSSTST